MTRERIKYDITGSGISLGIGGDALKRGQGSGGKGGKNRQKDYEKRYFY
ncbi:hypothetical protein CSE_05190 [Caldisericum exile AZM16c01]|uniref:Uncharacterized protein n=1 Tax=Caldisericum exile (strain DSM 21853 / NBRC 104410 / AZM16c01) TaxID=511051 RepID=A0A7U6JFV2_CALEA|nr:hypothetical protein CSE_05190 [Caldisericum exile AZM16c01]